MSDETGEVKVHPQKEDTTQHSEIEKILGMRVKLGVRPYKVKRKGLNNRHNSWRDVADLDCDDLMLEYNNGQTGTSKTAVMAQIIALIIMTTTTIPAVKDTHNAVVDNTVSERVEIPEVDNMISGKIGLPGMDSRIVVERLMRFQSLDGNTDELMDGYEAEIDHMFKRRLILLDHGRLLEC